MRTRLAFFVKCVFLIGLCLFRNSVTLGVDMPSATNANNCISIHDIQTLIIERYAATNDYYYVFDKLLPLSDRSINIISQMLNNEDSNWTNRSIRIYLLNGIAARCNHNASQLIPSIRKHLYSDSICEQLGALGALRSIGIASQSVSNDVANCLCSTSSFVRAEAALSLSVLGKKAKPFLHKLQNLNEKEIKFILRKKYEQAISNIETGVDE